MWKTPFLLVATLPQQLWLCQRFFYIGLCRVAYCNNLVWPWQFYSLETSWVKEEPNLRLPDLRPIILSVVSGLNSSVLVIPLDFCFGLMSTSPTVHYTHRFLFSFYEMLCGTACVTMVCGLSLHSILGMDVYFFMVYVCICFNDVYFVNIVSKTVNFC